MGRQEHLVEGGLARLRLLIGQAKAVEDLLDAGSSPRFDVHAALVLDEGLQFSNLLAQDLSGLICLIQIDGDALHPHLHQDFGQGLFDFEDGLKLLFVQFLLQDLPQGQRGPCVLFSVGPNVGGRKLPHILLGV